MFKYTNCPDKSYNRCKIVLAACLGYLLYGFTLDSKPSAVSNEDIYRGYNFIYDFEFQKADSCVKSFSKNYPNDLQVAMLSANLYWWKIIAADSGRQNRRLMLESLAKAEQILNAGKGRQFSEQELFYVINIHAYRSRLDLLDHKYFSATNRLNKSVNHMESFLGKDTQYKPLWLAMGLYNYFIARFKEQHPMAFIFNLPHANMERGIELLKTCITSGDEVVETESLYFLTKIYFDSKKDCQAAIPYAKAVIKKHSGNLIYQYLYFQVLLAEGKHEKIQEQLIQMNVKCKRSNLSQYQKNYFLTLAQKDLVEFYKRKKD